MYEVFENEGRITQEQLEKLQKLPVATICDALLMIGLHNGNVLMGNINPLQPLKTTVVGLATTVYAPDGLSTPVLLATLKYSKDRVLVVATNECMHSAYLGGIQGLIAKKVGCLGIVIDGLIRDKNALMVTSVPIFCRGTIPSRPTIAEGGSINTMITIGKVIIRNGDIICGDTDGVVVIPQEKIDEVIALAEEKEKRDCQRVDTINRLDFSDTASLQGFESIINKELKQYIDENQQEK